MTVEPALGSMAKRGAPMWNGARRVHARALRLYVPPAAVLHRPAPWDKIPS